jgi:MoaA/NifB/PqqE/SkfB family radical SAM enzyme
MSIISKQSNRNCSIKEAIVYQMGKVGSTSIVASLNSAGVSAFQSHFLDTPSFHRAIDKFDLPNSISEQAANHLSIQLQRNLILRNKVKQYQTNTPPREEKLGIITLVRDPLNWYFSNLAQNYYQVETSLRKWLESEQLLAKGQELDIDHIHHLFREVFSCFDKIVPDMERDHADLIQDAYKEASKTKEGVLYRFIYGQVAELNRIQFWFDTHFRTVFNHDLLHYTFPHAEGYIKHSIEDFDILLLKFEELDSLHQVIADFCGLSTFKMKFLNESRNKTIGKLVSDAKKSIEIPSSFKEKYYSSEYCEIFYSSTGEQPSKRVLLRRRRYLPPAIPGKPLNINDVSNYHQSKRKSLESFIEFAQGGELPKWPLEVFLEVSNVCDLKCAMCPTFSAINPKRFINLKHADRGLFKIENTAPLEEILEHAIIVHAFGYGEPTIHPQFKEFIAYVSQYEVMVDFFTHGMHLTQELCDFLVRNKIFRVTLSFSGATKDEYENIYLGGDFERVIAGIKRLSDTKKRQGSDFPSIEVNSLGFKHHVEKLPEFVELMGDNGVNVINLKPLQTYDVIEELHTHTSVMRTDVEGKILHKAKNVAKKYNLILASKPYEDTAYFADKFDTEAAQARHKGQEKLSTTHVEISAIKELAESKETKDAAKQLLKESESKGFQYKILEPGTTKFFTNKKSPCLEPFKTFYASYDGRVFPCCFKGTENSLGDLSDGQDGMSIWHNPMFTELKSRALLQELPAKLCGKCVQSGIYPKHHSIGQKIGHYARWFTKTFGAPFHSHIQKSARDLPDNEEILLQQRSAPTSSKDTNSNLF